MGPRGKPTGVGDGGGTLTQQPTVRTLADLLTSRTMNFAAIPLGALLIGAAAQLSVMTGMSTEPITGTTFAVLMVAAILGALRGSLAVLLYCGAGALGVPWFPGASAGMPSSSYGYALGFVLAAALVGWLAQRGWTRNPIDTALAFLLGDVVIFAVGVGWFAIATANTWTTAVAVGMSPFLLGEAIKIALAAVVLPLAWRLASPRADDGQPGRLDVDLRTQPSDAGPASDNHNEANIDLRNGSPGTTGANQQPPRT